ncbi:MAG: hypothetical protein QOE77_1381 [Blastocatellia bacterium]|jgi:hypothetical protein|nr:hypothetical protein [Blastocatellia bacterium]
MTANVTSENPVVQAIIAGKAPPAATMAAARGLLPLPQADLLEALVFLHSSEKAELAEAAAATLQQQQQSELLEVAKASTTAPSVLAYFAAQRATDREMQEAVALNPTTPDEAVATLATVTTDGQLLESIAVNQQRLIRAPAIIDAIIGNAARTPEAERRARETRSEFFEKERGAKQIAQELRARGNTAAAEFFENSDLSSSGGMSLEDAWLIAQHIEVSDEDIDDSWLPREIFEEFVVETPEQLAANAERIINSERLDGLEITPERVSLIRRIMFMTVKDRVKLGQKGDREARSILIRDSNKIVATAVINNPRITDHEVENIAAMRTVADEVLRIIGLNRTWTRSYPIIHNLTRNPRTPLPTAFHLLPHIRTKDLKHLTQNRNVAEGVRRQAYRLCEMRGGK